MILIMNAGAHCWLTGMAHQYMQGTPHIYLMSVIGPQNAVKSIWATFVNKKGELRLASKSYRSREKGDKYVRATFTSKRFSTVIDRETNFHNLVIAPIDVPNFLWVRNPACIDRTPTEEERQQAQAGIEAQLVAYVNTKATIALPQWGSWLWQQCIRHDAYTRLDVHGDVIVAVKIDHSIKWPDVISAGLQAKQISF